MSTNNELKVWPVFGLDTENLQLVPKGQHIGRDGKLYHNRLYGNGESYWDEASQSWMLPEVISQAIPGFEQYYAITPYNDTYTTYYKDVRTGQWYRVGNGGHSVKSTRLSKTDRQNVQILNRYLNSHAPGSEEIAQNISQSGPTQRIVDNGTVPTSTIVEPTSVQKDVDINQQLQDSYYKSLVENLSLGDRLRLGLSIDDRKAGEQIAIRNATGSTSIGQGHETPEYFKDNAMKAMYLDRYLGGGTSWLYGGDVDFDHPDAWRLYTNVNDQSKIHSAYGTVVAMDPGTTSLRLAAEFGLPSLIPSRLTGLGNLASNLTSKAGNYGKYVQQFTNPRSVATIVMATTPSVVEAANGDNTTLTDIAFPVVGSIIAWKLLKRGKNDIPTIASFVSKEGKVTQTDIPLKSLVGKSKKQLTDMNIDYNSLVAQADKLGYKVFLNKGKGIDYTRKLAAQVPRRLGDAATLGVGVGAGVVANKLVNMGSENSSGENNNQNADSTKVSTSQHINTDTVPTNIGQTPQEAADSLEKQQEQKVKEISTETTSTTDSTNVYKVKKQTGEPLTPQQERIVNDSTSSYNSSTDLNKYLNGTQP